MRAYLVKRLLLLIPTLVGVTGFVFAVLHLVPGDPVRTMLGEHAKAEDIERLTRQLDLDRPLPVQYARYVVRLAAADFGESIGRRTPVRIELARFFPATVELTLAAMFVALLIGIPAGIVAAVRRGSAVDSACMAASLIGVSLPIYFLGLLLLEAFSGILPTSNRLSFAAMAEYRPWSNMVLLDALVRGDAALFADGLKHLVLPALALATVPAAVIARIARSSLLDVIASDYVRTARAKGASAWRVTVRHALANAMIPIVTIVGLQFGYLLAGAVITETVFGRPGMGTYVVQAIADRDYPVVQSGILVVSLAFVSVNLTVDLLYSVLDPRVRHA